MKRLIFSLKKGQSCLNYGKHDRIAPTTAGNAVTLTGEININGGLPDGFCSLHFGLATTPSTRTSGNRPLLKVSLVPNFAEIDPKYYEDYWFEWEGFEGISNSDAEKNAIAAGAFLRADPKDNYCYGLVCYQKIMVSEFGMGYTTSKRVPYTFTPMNLQRSLVEDYQHVIQGGNFKAYELHKEIRDHVKFEGWKKPKNLLDPEENENDPWQIRRHTTGLFYAVSPHFDGLPWLNHHEYLDIFILNQMARDCENDLLQKELPELLTSAQPCPVED